MRIGEFARLTGVSVAQLRRYEAAGLLSPTARDEFGYRRYAAAQVPMATHLHRLVQAGVPTPLVTSLVEVLEDPSVSAQVRGERIRAVAAYLDLLAADPTGGMLDVPLPPPARTRHTNGRTGGRG